MLFVPSIRLSQLAFDKFVLMLDLVWSIDTVSVVVCHYRNVELHAGNLRCLYTYTGVITSTIICTIHLYKTPSFTPFHPFTFSHLYPTHLHKRPTPSHLLLHPHTTTRSTPQQKQELADLRAQVLALTAQVQAVSKRSSELETENQRQQSIMTHYEQGFADESVTPEGHTPPLTPPTPQRNQRQRQPQRQPQQPPQNPLPSTSTRSRFPHPCPAPTLHYIAARTAQSLKLSYIIPGSSGEALDFRIDTTDLAFILTRTLEKRGWSEELVHRSVLEFLGCPMVGVQWMGREGEIGMLR